MSEQKNLPIVTYSFPAKDHQPISIGLTSVTSRLNRLSSMTDPQDIARELPGIQRIASYGSFLQVQLGPSHTTQSVKDLLEREKIRKEAVLKAIIAKNDGAKVAQDMAKVPDARYRSDGSEPQIANIATELMLLNSAIQSGGDIRTIVTLSEAAVHEREEYLRDLLKGASAINKTIQQSAGPRAALTQLAGRAENPSFPDLSDLIGRLGQTFAATDVYGIPIPGKVSHGVIAEAGKASSDGIVLTENDYRLLEVFSQRAKPIIDQKIGANPQVKVLYENIKRLQRTDKAFQVAMGFGGKGVVSDSNVSSVVIIDTPAGPVIHAPPSVYDLWQADNNIKYLAYALDKHFSRPLPPEGHPEEFIARTARLVGRSGTSLISDLQKIQKVLY